MAFPALDVVFGLTVNLLSKMTPFLPPNNGPPLRDGRTVGEEPQPDQPAGRTIPFLSMQISSLAAFPSLPDEKEFLQSSVRELCA